MIFAKEEPTKIDQRLNTIIGPGSDFVGELSVQGGIRIDGNIEGKVAATGPLTVGQQAKIVAPSVEASSATIGGSIEGDIVVKDRIRLETTARVKGNMSAKVLIIEEGARFIGNMDMPSEPAPTSA